MNSKAASQRYQRQLLELAKLPGNDVCADCRGRNPRWASHNLGVFLCVHCAGIHRKLGTHITKVKSLILDEWTREQVERMREMGNIKSNEYYNPDERRNHPPANVENGERDSDLERFVRNKYEYRRFMNKLPPPLPIKDEGPQQSVSSRPAMPNSKRASSSRRSTLAPSDHIERSRTAPIPGTWMEAKRAASPLPALPPEAMVPASSPASSSATATPSLPSMPSIFVSAAPAHPPQHSSTVLSQPPVGIGLTANQAPTASLQPSVPSLPQRASSAQGLSGPGPHGSASCPMTTSPNTAFEGRSRVFDDLLSLTKPPEVQPQQQLQQFGVPFLSQEWSSQQTPQQMKVAGPPHMAAMQTGVADNPWAQMQQQTSPFSMSSAIQFPTGMNATGLGSMAFGSHMGSFSLSQQPMQNLNTGTSMGPFGTADYMGPSQAVVSPVSRLPSNPFFHQQKMPYKQQYAAHSGPRTFGPASAQQLQQQPSFQLTDPCLAHQTIAQQRFESGQVFDDWTKGMMPGQK